MKVDLLIHSASQLLTLSGGPQRGDELGQLGIIEDGAVAILGERVHAIGTTNELRQEFEPKATLHAIGQVIMPGFVDPHTHLIWAGDRADEFEARASGSTYMEILSQGGGILSTVRHTRAAEVSALIMQARLRLNRMLSHGTTTAEAKTGYGLALEPELRMLRAILRLDEQGPVELAPTFLPAHAVPAGVDADIYVDQICTEMLPAAVEWWRDRRPESPLPFVDVFCEEGAFDLGQSRRLLTAASELNFPLKIHADEFASLGGTGLAIELGAVSADHLVHTPPDEIQALGKSQTVAVALPATPFGLGETEYTPAREFLQADALLSIATDLNPGTAWCESMQFVIALATRYMGLTPAQAIAACTINAAAAIGRDQAIGSLETGKQADLLILEVDDYRHLGYRFGTNLVHTVIKKGQVVVDRRRDGFR
ncbi:MAG: imidazolonepropionase [Anaerolineales bacterium]